MSARGLWRVDSQFLNSEGLAWCKEFLTGYDLSKLSRLTIRDGSKRNVQPGVWGTCYYPDKDIPSYRISCSLKGPFPAVTHTRQSPLYADENGSYPPVPHGLIPGQAFMSTRKGKTRRWIRLYGETRLHSPDEAIVWIVAHEAYHYLRKTRQILGKNAEIEADRFSDAVLEGFK